MHKVNPNKNKKKKWTIISSATVTEEVEFENELTQHEAESWYSYGQILEGKSVRVDTELLEVQAVF